MEEVPRSMMRVTSPVLRLPQATQHKWDKIYMAERRWRYVVRWQRLHLAGHCFS